MAFNGNEGSDIGLTKGAELTKNYREANPGKEQAYFLGRNILQSLLDQPGSKGIRFYYGLDGSAPVLVAVTADENENDQLDPGFIVADEGMGNPPHSGNANPLNS